MLKRLFNRSGKDKRQIILEDYERAMKSGNIKFVEEVLNRYGMEIGDDRNYYRLNMRLIDMKKHYTHWRNI